MSIDKIINFALDIFCPSSSKNDKKIIINKKFIKNGSEILKVIIPPRGNGNLLVTDILMKRFSRIGYSSLSYYFDGELLSDDIDQTLINFDNVTKELKKDIDKLKKEYNFKRVDVVAPSLGVVSACLIANKNNNIDNLYLLVPGSCLASSLWEGIRTKDFKEEYVSRGITEDGLKNTWASLAPKNNIDDLSNKKIFIVISKSDEIIPYKFGKEFASIVKNKYPETTIIYENKYLGHYLTVLKYYLLEKELLK